MSIEIQRKECPVCGDEFPYMDVRNVPATCSKKMCQVNYQVQSNRMTPDGQSPTLERLGKWNASKTPKDE